MPKSKEHNEKSGINQVLQDIKRKINEFGCMSQLSAEDRKKRYDGLNECLDELRDLLPQQESELENIFSKIKELVKREAVLESRIEYFTKSFDATNTRTDENELSLIQTKLKEVRTKKDELLYIIGQIDFLKKSAKTFLSGINRSVRPTYDN